jgi:two-component system chemotaxis response regulator CheY
VTKFDKHTCLIVDDYSTARRLIKNALQQMGFSCLEAENGEQALTLIQQTALNLVIADVKMPKINGLALLKEIRSDDNMKDLPVVLTMMEPFEDLITEAEKLGMNDYLIKPFDVFTLSKVLDKVIKTTGGESL